MIVIKILRLLGRISSWEEEDGNFGKEIKT